MLLGNFGHRLLSVSLISLTESLRTERGEEQVYYPFEEIRDANVVYRSFTSNEPMVVTASTNAPFVLGFCPTKLAALLRSRSKHGLYVVRL